MVITKNYRILYPGLINVEFKDVTRDSEPDPAKRTISYAKGPNDADWFEFKLDGWGNVCNMDGIVVYPSLSGKHPLQAGERSYFDGFRESYPPDSHPELKSVHSMTIRAARVAAGMTQQQLADKSGVNIRQIQRVESGSSAAENLTAKNFLAIADALGVDPHELI